MDSRQRIAALSCIALLLGGLPPQASAESASMEELEALRQQIDELKRHNSLQDNVLRNIILRLRQMDEAAQGAAPAAAGEGQTPRPAPETTAPAPVSPAGAAGPVSGEAPEARVGETAAPAIQGEAEAENRPEVSAGVESLASDKHARFQRRFSVETGLAYSRSDRAQMHLNGFLVLDAIFLGQINIDQVKSDTFIFDFTTRMGLSERTQVDLHAPFLYRTTTYQSGSAEATAPAVSEATVREPWQLGDISLGLSWNALRETPRRPDTVWTLRVKAPTGSSPYGIKLVPADPESNLHVPERLPSGSGVWSASTGVSLMRTVDPAVLFANLNYTHNFEERVDDLSTAEGSTVPGRVRLGNSVQFGAGTAFALSERLSLSYSYSQRIARATRTRAEGGEWSSIVGSDANAASLSLGLTYGLGPRTSLTSSLGIGLTPDAPDVQFGLKLPFSI